MENICVCIVSFYQLLHHDTVHVRHKCVDTGQCGTFLLFQGEFCRYCRYLLLLSSALYAQYVWSMTESVRRVRA